MNILRKKKFSYLLCSCFTVNEIAMPRSFHVNYRN